MGDAAPLTGPDLTRGVPSADVPTGGRLLGQAGGEGVLLVRTAEGLYAVGASCTHYGAALAQGLVAGDTLHCPWHHARFDLASGEAIGPPALNPLPCWDVVEQDGHITVTTRRAHVPPPPRVGPQAPSSVLIIGAGAAGESAAEELRRRGYQGPVTLLDTDADTPIDRPNLSKDILSGAAPDDWLWLHPGAWYEERTITRHTARVMALEPRERRVRLEGGHALTYGVLLLATGATALPLELPGSGPPVFTLRTRADLRAILKAAEGKTRVVVVGASFVGLEVAASLRARGLEVQVVGSGPAPLATVFGPELGSVVRSLHEGHGVVFHLGQRPNGLVPGGVQLTGGTTLPADLVVAGVGVRPSTALAEAAGLAVDRGVLVDEHLRTSDPSIWAAGDVARFPDARGGGTARIEHWSVAQGQGRVAARNLAGLTTPYRDVPFFWSQHYDVTIGYVGHAPSWDRLEVEGDPAKLDCLVRFFAGGRLAAVAAIGRDRALLEAHAALEAGG